MEKRLNEIIDKLIKDFNVPSIMVSVYKDGKTIFCGSGFSDVENNIEASPDTIYAIASVSKSFIATALCILADEGKLSLDDPVKKHLPDFEMYDPYMTDHLTIRDALGHRSGLPRHDLMWFNIPDVDIYEIIRRLKYLEPSFEPRYRMHYQNHMFILATVLVEKITGEKWEDFIARKIFKPLGMTSTYTSPKGFRGKGLREESKSYAYIDNKVKAIPYIDFNNIACAGNINSTVRDLDKWVRLHLGRGEFEGVRIFSKEACKNLHNPQMIIKSGEMMPSELDFKEIDFTAYCQGFFAESYRGHKLVHHGGTINGYKSLAGFLPNDDVAFSILTNLDSNQTPMVLGYIICDLALGLSEIEWGSRILNEVNKVKSKEKEESLNLKKQTENPTPPSHDLKEYVGEYEHLGYGKVIINLKGDQLKINIISEEFDLLKAGFDNFLIDAKKLNSLIPLKFDYDFTGKIDKVYIKLEPFTDMICFMKK